jgi:hypothetical protein
MTDLLRAFEPGVRVSDPQFAGALRVMARRLQDLTDGGEAVTRAPEEKRDVQRLPDPHLAKITAWQVMPGNPNRWLYAWNEVTIGPTGTISTPTRRRGGTIASNPAYCVAEMSNPTTTGLMGAGVDTSSPSPASSITVKPIGAGAAGVPTNQLVVLMHYVWSSGSGGPIPVFVGPVNSLGVTC